MNRQILQADVRKHIEHLAYGFLGCDFYVIPKRIICLFEGLKSHGFISDKTELSDFVVVFGFPYRRKPKGNGFTTDFKPVQWMKNAQLYRCFLSNVFSEDVLRFCGLLCRRLCLLIDGDLKCSGRRLTNSVLHIVQIMMCCANC